MCKATPNDIQEIIELRKKDIEVANHIIELLKNGRMDTDEFGHLITPKGTIRLLEKWQKEIMINETIIEALKQMQL